MAMRRPNRVRLRAFWLTTDGLAGGALELGAVRFGLHWAAILGAAGVVVAALAGWFDPDVALPFYEAWSWAASWARRLLLAWTLLLAFQVVRAAAWARSPEGGAADPGSGWSARTTTPAASYPGTSPLPEPDGSRHWIARLVTWSWRSRQPWVLALVPFLVLLRGVGGARAMRALQGRLYTLY
jgi:hypothetical protein